MTLILEFVIAILIILIFIFWLHERKLKAEQYEFFTIVTHKFRTPLTGIKWAIQSLQKEITYQEKDTILKQMESSEEKLMEIVDLLTSFVKFNKKLDYAFEAASIQEMVQTSLSKNSDRVHTKNIKFTFDADPNVPFIVIDKRKIQFVVDMLIDNALKYTPAEGSVMVSISSDRKNVLLAIADTGMGLTRQDKSHLFTKFYRSPEAKVVDTEGMGLGLYTARTIATHHGGHLWAESEGKDKGTTFFLELPLSTK